MDSTQDTLFSIYRGDDYGFSVLITDEQEQPVDITGWEFKATLKRNFMDSDDKATVKVDIEPVAGPEAQDGTFHLLLPNDQTMNLEPGPYFFDLQREFNGLVTTVIRGRVRVIPDVTRRTSHG